jgi:predicted nucleotidyltransferase
MIITPPYICFKIIGYTRVMSTGARYTLDEIVHLVTPIISQYKAVHRAFIFGSYAQGKADNKSDVDIRIDADGLKAMDYCGLAGRLMIA